MITGDGLRRERGRLRQTQRELAARAGVSLRTLTGWESLGPRQLPAAAEGRLAAVLGVATGGATGLLADVTDADLIAELARRLQVTGSGAIVDRSPDPAAGSAPASDALGRTGQQRLGSEDYPSDPTAEGTVGTPRDDTAASDPGAWRESVRNLGLQLGAGDPSNPGHRRQRP